MKNAYPLFADCSVLGNNPAKRQEFINLLRVTAKKYQQVIMTDRQMVTCPNFRRTLELESEDGQWLRQQITQGKVRAAMFDVYDEPKKHMTFAIFQQWFNQCVLWELTPPQEKKIKQWLGSQSWDYQMPMQYRDFSKATRDELRFLDTYTQKILVNSESRDRDYVTALLGGLDNPVLKQCLGKHHETFKTITQDVYADPQYASTGTILVTPNAHVWNYDKNMNISWRFLTALIDQNPHTATVRASRAVIQAYSDATMANITTRLVANEMESGEVTPVFSPDQTLQQEMMDNANTRTSALDNRKRTDANPSLTR